MYATEHLLEIKVASPAFLGNVPKTTFIHAWKFIEGGSDSENIMPAKLRLDWTNCAKQQENKLHQATTSLSKHGVFHTNTTTTDCVLWSLHVSTHMHTHSYVYTQIHTYIHMYHTQCLGGGEGER